MEPVDEFRILSKRTPVLRVTDHFVIIDINFPEYLLHFTAVDPDVAIDQAAPVVDYLGEVLVELFEADQSVAVDVHQGETELTLLVLRPIAEHVHNGHELVKQDYAVSIGVKDFENSVRQVGVLLLAKQAHLGSELLLFHRLDRLLNFGACSSLNHYFLLGRCFFEMLFEFVDLLLLKPSFAIGLPEEHKILL